MNDVKNLKEKYIKNLKEYIEKLNTLRSGIPNNDIYLENLEETNYDNKQFVNIFDRNVQKVIEYENKLKGRIQINKENELKKAEENNRLLEEEEGEKKEIIKNIIKNNIEINGIMKKKPKIQIEEIKKQNYDDMPKINEIQKINNLIVLKRFYEITKEYLASIKEQLGKIRTYLKVRDGSKPVGDDNNYAKIIEPNGIEITCLNNNKFGKEYYGPFYKLLNNTENKKTFDEIKENFDWDNIKGQTLILFAYGVTGSGKTTTFFKDDGLIYSIYEHFNNNKDYTISVDDIIENRMKYSDFDSEVKEDYEFIEISKYDELQATFINDKLIGEINREDFKELINQKDIKEILRNIEEKRKTNKNATIKATPYDKESSRSHIFISLQIKKNGTDEVSYIVLCDSAGRETPSELIIRYYNNERNIYINPSRAFYKCKTGYDKCSAFINLLLKDVKEESYISKDILDKKIRLFNYYEFFTKIMSEKKNARKFTDEEKNVFKEIQRYLKNVIKESYFIGETLNIISKILDDKIEVNYVNGNIENYDDDKKGEKSKKDIPVNTVKLITPYDKDQTKIQKIFNDIIAKTGNKYKFVMLATLNVEKTQLQNYIKCNEAQNTLAFTNLIKST